MPELLLRCHGRWIDFCIIRILGTNWKKSKSMVSASKSQEVKVDLLLSPYYANQKALLDKLVWYKSAVRCDEWTWIVRTYVRLVFIYRLYHKYTCILTIIFVLSTKICRFSASASKWQVEFIERFSNQVHVSICIYTACMKQ